MIKKEGSSEPGVWPSIIVVNKIWEINVTKNLINFQNDILDDIMYLHYKEASVQVSWKSMKFGQTYLNKKNCLTGG